VVDTPGSVADGDELAEGESELNWDMRDGASSRDDDGYAQRREDGVASKHVSVLSSEFKPPPDANDIVNDARRWAYDPATLHATPAQFDEFDAEAEVFTPRDDTFGKAVRHTSLEDTMNSSSTALPRPTATSDDGEARAATASIACRAVRGVGTVPRLPLRSQQLDDEDAGRATSEAMLLSQTWGLSLPSTETGFPSLGSQYFNGRSSSLEAQSAGEDSSAVSLPSTSASGQAASKQSQSTGSVEHQQADAPVDTHHEPADWPSDSDDDDDDAGSYGTSSEGEVPSTSLPSPSASAGLDERGMQDPTGGHGRFALALGGTLSDPGLIAEPSLAAQVVSEPVAPALPPAAHVRMRLPPTSPMRRPRALDEADVRVEAQRAEQASAAPSARALATVGAPSASATLAATAATAATLQGDRGAEPSVWQSRLLGTHFVPAPYKIEQLATLNGGTVPTQDPQSVLKVTVSTADGGYRLYADVLVETSDRAGVRSSHRDNDRFHGAVTASSRRAKGLSALNRKMPLAGTRLRPASRSAAKVAERAERTKKSSDLSVRSRLGAGAVEAEIAAASRSIGHGTTPVDFKALDSAPAVSESAKLVAANIRCQNGIFVHIVDKILFPGDDPRC
jgi:hypothetical protein